MLKKELFLKIYEAASMQRWNDQIRIFDFTELDKQAHKMVISYVLGKRQEEKSSGIDWIKIIEAGIFEFFWRMALTDLKPQVFRAIKEDDKKYKLLNEWIYNEISPIISPLGKDFSERFKSYLHDKKRDINRMTIAAAHFYSTKWEFDIIKHTSPRVHQLKAIEAKQESDQKKYSHLRNANKLLSYRGLRDFIDICGQLRFQIRWSHFHMVPKTSVLGHMLIVAMFSYFFSLEAELNRQRKINNYFTGLFHDLPEVLTRDIISPVKRSVEGLKDLIQEYEHQQMEENIYKLIPKKWHPQMTMFTEDEFSDIKERDGEMVKAADKLAAFIEAHLSLKNGIFNKDLEGAKSLVVKDYKNKNIAGINFNKIYREFK
jgi:putative hydrolases of HD superfamily